MSPLLSIRNRLLLAFVALALTPLLIAGSLLTLHLKSVYLQNAASLQAQRAERIGHELKNFLTQRQLELTLPGHSHDLPTLSTKEQEGWLDNLLAARDIYLEASLLNAQGEVLSCRSNERFFCAPPPEGNWQNHNAFAIPSRTGSPYVGPAQFDTQSGMPWLWVSTPFINLNTGQLQGIIVAKIRLQAIWDLLAQLDLQAGEDTYILNANNRIIAHGNPSIVLHGTTVSRSEKQLQRSWLTGKPAVLAYTPVKVSRQEFTVVAEQAVSNALQPLSSSLVLVVAVLLAAMAGVVALGGLTERQIFTPLRYLAKATRQLAAGNFEQQLPIPPGHEFAELTRAFNLMVDNLQGTLAHLQDEVEVRTQTEDQLRRSEERYRSLIESTSDWIWEVDANGIYTYSSPKIEEFLGYRPEEVVGKSPFDLMPPEEAKRVGQLFAKILTDRSHIHRLENMNIHKDGREVILETSGVPLLDDQGTLRGYRGIDRDITERKLYEKEKRQLAGQLRQSQKLEAVGTLAGGIAHDFNNILTPILGFTEILREKLSQEGMRYHEIEEIYKAGIRAKELVKQILYFSRQSEEERKPIQVQLIVKEALKLLRASLPTSIEIRQEINSRQCYILAVPTHIHQIVVNLCTNASYAMQETGGVLSVCLTRLDLAGKEAEHLNLPPGPFCRLQVADTGPGFGPEVMERIFDPYFTTKPQGEGTGLGLSVVHGIVNNMQGKITATSTPGKGATFEVYLPVLTSATVEQTVIDDSPPPGGNERIMVVDDEPTITDLEKRILTTLGYQVTTFTDSNMALEALCNRPDSVDLVLTDMTMPGLTGVELARKVLKVRPEMPIVLCTGYSALINEEQARQIGIRAFVMKPVVRRALATAIRSALDQKPAAGE